MKTLIIAWLKTNWLFVGKWLLAGADWEMTPEKRCFSGFFFYKACNILSSRGAFSGASGQAI